MRQFHIGSFIPIDCSSRFKKKAKDPAWLEKFERRQQLIDNILAELLLYPTILCSLAGVASDRVWGSLSDPNEVIDYDEHVVSSGSI